MTAFQKTVFVAVFVLALFFRFDQIQLMPGGLFPDEAANGLDINLMQQGHLQPFYERGNGREALFFYLEWASIAAFGKGPWQHHIVSAAIGLLAVVSCYFVTYRLFMMDVLPGDEKKKRRAINIALLAMFLMAVSSWHTVLSRTAFRATMIPLMSALTFYFLLRTYQAATNKSRLLFAVFSGASFALGFYTYIAFRIMAPILAMALVWPWLSTLKTRTFTTAVKRYAWPALVFVVAFVIFFYPLGKYFFTHQDSFIGRSGQVSIFNPGLYTVNGEQLHGTPPLSTVLQVMGEVFKTTMLGFFTHGDLNWRHNISGYPFLSPLVSPFFALGLLGCTVFGIWYFFAPVKRREWWKFYVLFGWFIGMLLPVITTAEGIPHGLRTIGVIPVVFILAAWALYEFSGLLLKLHRRIWEKCWCHFGKHFPYDEEAMASRNLPINSHHCTRFTVMNWLLILVVVCYGAALVIQSYSLYFVYAANSPENFFYFRSDLSEVSQYLVNRCKKDSTYLVLDKFSVQTTDYLTSDPHGNFNSPCSVPYRQVDPENAWQLQDLKPGDAVVFTQSSVFDTVKFKEHHPEMHLTLEERNKFKQAVMAVYEMK